LKFILTAERKAYPKLVEWVLLPGLDCWIAVDTLRMSSVKAAKTQTLIADSCFFKVAGLSGFLAKSSGAAPG
jgi:hypothetical protein